MGNGLNSANDITHWKRAEDFGRFWKSQSWDETCFGGRRLVFRLLTETFVAGARRFFGWGTDEKARIERLYPLSPYVEKPLNSKVIKSFVHEQRSRQVFFLFRDSYVLSLWTFDVRFIHSHIMAMVQTHYWCPTCKNLIKAVSVKYSLQEDLLISMVDRDE